MKSKLLNFISTHKKWCEILSSPPYNVNIKRKDNLYLFKYTMDTDFGADDMLLECRGTIVEIIAGETPRIVCSAMPKFFNYNEVFAAKVDISNSEVTQKIDGTNIRFYFYKGEWHCATLGTIDASEAPLGANSNFNELIEEVIGCSIQEFAYKASFAPDYTYIFELTSPKNQIVIPYENALWGLCIINNIFLLEEPMYESKLWKLPKYYSFSSLEDCVKVVNELPDDEEGYVALDCDTGARIKIKSPAYFAKHRLKGNGANSVKYILSIMEQDLLDDYLSISPENAGKVHQVMEKKNELLRAYDVEWRELVKQFAQFINSSDCNKGFAFAMLRGKAKNAEEWFNSIPLNKKVELLENEEKE